MAKLCFSWFDNVIICRQSQQQLSKPARDLGKLKCCPSNYEYILFYFLISCVTTSFYPLLVSVDFFFLKWHLSIQIICITIKICYISQVYLICPKYKGIKYLLRKTIIYCWKRYARFLITWLLLFCIVSLTDVCVMCFQTSTIEVFLKTLRTTFT